jgi:uncharacterized membrane protein
MNMTRRCYNRALLAVIVISGVAAAAGIALLITGITTPGILCFLAGVLIGTIAGMEWRCRERSVTWPLQNVNATASPIVVVISKSEPAQPLSIK